MDGRQVLDFIKTDASLRTIPTIVLSISDEQSGVQKSYELQANCYLSKLQGLGRVRELDYGHY